MPVGEVEEEPLAEQSDAQYFDEPEIEVVFF